MEKVKKHFFPRTLTPEERIEAGRKGGIIQGQNRKKRLSMQKTAEAILSMSVGLLDDQILEAIKYLKPEMTVQDAIIHTQAIKAIQFADTKAAEFVRDTSGQKPTDKTEVKASITYEDVIRQMRAEKVEKE